MSDNEFTDGDATMLNNLLAKYFTTFCSDDTTEWSVTERNAFQALGEDLRESISDERYQVKAF